MGIDGSVAFLSYSHKDHRIAQKLVEALSNEHFDVWWDGGEDDRIRVGTPVDIQLEAVIDEASFFLSLVTENSKASKWWRKELGYAMSSPRINEALIVLPVAVGQVQMPLRLADVHYAKFDPRAPGASVSELANDMRKFYEDKFKTAPAVPAKGRIVTGNVKWFKDARRFGFITQDGGGEDVFAHHTTVAADGFRTLVEGQKVEFDVAKGPKGLRPQNIRPIS